MLKPNEFAILPWGGTPGDEAALKEIRECGFNLAGFVAPDDLDKVSRAGLQCLVSDPTSHVGDAEAQLDEKEIARRVEALTARTAKHPAVYGYYLRDEPSTGAYPGLGRWAAAYEKAAPGALPYINLLPNYASAGQLGASTYEEYLESFVQTVKPKFISYDHYALMDDGSLRGGYYQNLEAVRKAALKHDLPFWNIVLSNSHFRYAEPTPAGFRFQLYTTLAYGGRGISYFTYFAPQIGNYRLAPVDQFGHKTPTWDMLRNVNLQLYKIGPTYIKLKSVNVFHHPNVPDGCSGIGTSKYLASVSGDDLLVGEFEGPGGVPYVMLVNKSLHVSTAFGVQFKESGQIMRVSAYTGSTDPWRGEDCWLAAGQGMLLCLQK
ncbi:MAG: hypothetical protein KBC96_07090 [Armatimonadetes bacterium]|nr:hypothetical protein [Armatimonadota bacterium]